MARRAYSIPAAVQRVEVWRRGVAEFSLGLSRSVILWNFRCVLYTREFEIRTYRCQERAIHRRICHLGDVGMRVWNIDFEPLQFILPQGSGPFSNLLKRGAANLFFGVGTSLFDRPEGHPDSNVEDRPLYFRGAQREQCTRLIDATDEVESQIDSSKVRTFGIQANPAAVESVRTMLTRTKNLRVTSPNSVFFHLLLPTIQDVVTCVRIVVVSPWTKAGS